MTLQADYDNVLVLHHLQIACSLQSWPLDQRKLCMCTIMRVSLKVDSCCIAAAPSRQYAISVFNTVAKSAENVLLLDSCSCVGIMSCFVV